MMTKILYKSKSTFGLNIYYVNPNSKKSAFKCEKV